MDIDLIAGNRSGAIDPCGWTGQTVRAAAVRVTIHWYNPLVWAGAFLSQRDAELACDEGALHRMGDSERTAYARTLSVRCGEFTASTEIRVIEK